MRPALVSVLFDVASLRLSRAHEINNMLCYDETVLVTIRPG
jgi:hypothetical protein